jgi:hypothetical protein
MNKTCALIVSCAARIPSRRGHMGTVLDISAMVTVLPTGPISRNSVDDISCLITE